MIRDEPSRPHIETYRYVMSLVNKALYDATLTYQPTIIAAAKNAVSILEHAFSEWNAAKINFQLADTDATMIDLNGHWARLNRLLVIADEEFGSKT